MCYECYEIKLNIQQLPSKKWKPRTTTRIVGQRRCQRTIGVDTRIGGGPKKGPETELEREAEQCGKARTHE